MQYITSAVNLILQTVFGLALFIIILRFLLQLARTNFFNPICQSLLKITNPIIIPLQKILPTHNNISYSTLFLAFITSCAWMAASLWLTGQQPNIIIIAIIGLAQLLQITIQLLFWIVIIRIILSWVSSSVENPVIPLIFRISDLILVPFQRLIPILGGFDISPIFALLALQVAEILLVRPLFALTLSF